MGSFFTNVQVRLGDAELEPLLAALRADATDAVEVDAPDEADRTVLVLPPDAGGWVAIYDQRTESQDLGALEALGRLASRATGAPTVSILVHDSDVLDLRLYRDGELVDRFDSFPGYFEGEATDAERAEAAGHPERWTPALAGGVETEALAAVFGAEDGFAERTLAEACALLGCDPRRASLGYRYAAQDPADEAPVTLRFRLRERPAHERKLDGPPSLEAHASVPAVELAVGDGLRLGYGARSIGGPGRGLSVVVWGEALDLGLLAIDRLELLVGDVRAGARHEVAEPERAGSDGGPCLVLERPEQLLPAGSAMPFGFVPGVDVAAMMNAMAAGSVHVNVVGRVLAPGRGALHVGFVPHDDRERGQTSMTTDVTVGPALRRPLRFAEPPLGASSHLLRPLAGDTHLSALVVLADRAAGAAWARQWLDDAPEGDVQLAVFRADPGKRPKTRQGPLRRLRRAVEADMVHELTVQLSAPGWSLTFGTGALAHREERRVPCLHVTTTRLDRRTPFRDRIDEAVSSGLVLQAALYRSGAEQGGPDVTAYEVACGAPYGATTARAWCERWVRVPGDLGLWLGPTLLERLDDPSRGALAEIAALDPIGEHVRVRLRDRADLDALERALAAVLPSAEDAREAVTALHAEP